MSSNSPKHTELRGLMGQALEASVLLQKYTDENFDVFFSDDDARINNVIDNRDRFIQALISIEAQTDAIFAEAAEYACGKALPNDVDEMRRSIRAVLSEISLKDIEIMKRISSRMQLYKTQTLKARNQKNISAYMRAAFSKEPGDSVDFTK